MIDLLLQQDRLQKEARAVIERLKQIDFLGQFGKVQIVGSVALGLMTWRDIDIEVVKKPEIDEFLETAKYLLIFPNVRQITLENHTKDVGNDKPNGLYLGTRAHFKTVIPCLTRNLYKWIPAFAGMTGEVLK